MSVNDVELRKEVTALRTDMDHMKEHVDKLDQAIYGKGGLQEIGTQMKGHMKVLSGLGVLVAAGVIGLFFNSFGSARTADIDKKVQSSLDAIERKEERILRAIEERLPKK